MRLQIFGLFESDDVRCERRRKELEIRDLLSVRQSSIGELVNYVKRLKLFRDRAEQRLLPPEGTDVHDKP